MSLMKAGVVVFLALLVQACETVPVENTVVIPASTVVVLPATSLHTELDSEYAQVQALLVKGLKKRGFKAVLLRGEAYKQLRSEALTVSGSVYDPKMAKVIPLNPGAYTKALIDLMREHNDYDVVLMPELALRTASIKGDEAVWDGVEREFTWREKPADTYVLPSKASGLSLHITAYTDRGAQIFQTFNGIGLPYDLRLEKGRFLFDLKEKYFTQSELKDAVKAAFKPFDLQVELDD